MLSPRRPIDEHKNKQELFKKTFIENDPNAYKQFEAETLPLIYFFFYKHNYGAPIPLQRGERKEELVMDIFDDAVIAMLARLPTLENDKNFKFISYFCKIISRMVINAIQQRTKKDTPKVVTVDTYIPYLKISFENTTLQRLIFENNLDEYVENAINTLKVDEKTKKILKLSLLSNLSRNEIAQISDTTPNNVSKIVGRYKFQIIQNVLGQMM